jgi:hypothetical protein
MENSAIPLEKWLVALWMICNCKNGVSSYEIAKTIGITQKSAWFMLHRIRTAFKSQTGTKVGGPEGGPVEVDETWVGGKSINMHKDRRVRYKTAGRHYGKATVMGILDREQQLVFPPNHVRLMTSDGAAVARIEHIRSGLVWA